VAIQNSFYIWFERSGGFTGISTSVEIDSKLLSYDESEELKQLIDQSDFFELIKNDTIQVSMPDQFQYTITIKDDRAKRTVEFSDITMPDTMRPLINYLSQKARSKKTD
jgi:hypothetical protein